MLEKNSFRILALVRITITIKLNTFTFINSQQKKKKRIASFVTKMNKTKDPITRWYKKKKKLFENKIDYFPLHTQAHIHAHTFIADTSNDWCFACTKGGRICPEWCETVQQRLWIIPRANKVAYPDGPRAIPSTYTETIYIDRFPIRGKIKDSKPFERAAVVGETTGEKSTSVSFYEAR